MAWQLETRHDCVFMHVTVARAVNAPDVDTAAKTVSGERGTN